MRGEFESQDIASGFIPTADQSTIKVPTTIDRQGGRREKYRNKWIWATAILIIIITITIGMLFQKEVPFFTKIITAFLFFSITTLVLRFGFLKEGRIRNRMVDGRDNNYDISTSNFWGITRISNEEPYVCIFPNNKEGIFVVMEKGVFKGDLTTAKHNHRSAIADFYKMIGDKASGQTLVSVTHIDLMDYVGTDPRIDEARDSISYTDNVELKRDIQGIYDDVKERASQMVFTSDIFVFQWTGQRRMYLPIIQEGLSRMMQGGGYIGYSYMDSEDLMKLYKTLFNVCDFSLVQAKRDAVVEASERDIYPVAVYFQNGGVLKLNYTKRERQQQNEYARAHKEAQKRRRKEPDFKTENLGVERPNILNKGYSGPVQRPKNEQENKNYDDDEIIYF